MLHLTLRTTHIYCFAILLLGITVPCYCNIISPNAADGVTEANIFVNPNDIVDNMTDVTVRLWNALQEIIPNQYTYQTSTRWPDNLINVTGKCQFSVARMELLLQTEKQIVAKLQTLMEIQMMELQGNTSSLQKYVWLQSAQHKLRFLTNYNALIKIETKLDQIYINHFANPLRFHSIITRIVTVLNGIITSIYQNEKEFSFSKEVYALALAAARKIKCWPNIADHWFTFDALGRAARSYRLSKIGILSGQVVEQRDQADEAKNTSFVNLINKIESAGVSSVCGDKLISVENKARDAMYRVFRSGGVNVHFSNSWAGFWDPSAWETELKWLEQKRNYNSSYSWLHAFDINEVADLVAILYTQDNHLEIVDWARIALWLELRRQRCLPTKQPHRPASTVLLNDESADIKDADWYSPDELPGAYRQLRNPLETGPMKLLNASSTDYVQLSTGSAFRIASFAVASFLKMNVSKPVIYSFLKHIKHLFENSKYYKNKILYLNKSAMNYYALMNQTLPSNLDVQNFEEICRGEFVQPTLYCTYERPYNGWLAYKLEILNMDPLVQMYYNVISDNEINQLKKYSREHLILSNVVNDSTMYFDTARQSEQAWVNNNNPPVSVVLDQRIALITGLIIKNGWYYLPEASCEEYQIVNYGNSGMYLPHHDYLCPTVPEACNYNDRLATWIFYMSDHELGGGTAMIKSKILMKAVKGAAVLWYNVFRNGDSNINTLHGGCSVVLGSKWIATKWIHQKENMFSRKCLLNPNL